MPRKRRAPAGAASANEQKLAAYRMVRDLRWNALESGQPTTPDGLLEAAGLRYIVSCEDLSRLRRSGSLVLTVASSFSILDGLVLASALPKARLDVKILANCVLADVPGFDSVFIAVDPWSSKRAESVNHRAMGEAVRWLENQGMLVTFPGGDCLAQRPGSERSGWSTMPLRLARLTGAPIVPVNLASVTTLQPRTEVEVRIGSPMSWEKLIAIQPADAAAEYVRWHAVALGRRHREPIRAVPRMPSDESDPATHSPSHRDSTRS